MASEAPQYIDSPGWIFLDRDQVDGFYRAIVEADGEGTVDQLGFNLLTNEISERLFPWCSTLTTRARYFFTSTAILSLALERVSSKQSLATTGDSLTRGQLRERSTAFQNEILKLERILAVSLYAKYLDQGGNGIFGKRNLDKIKDRQVDTVLTKKLLSLPGRYPNAIYRGGLQTLHLFTQSPMSNTLAVRLSMNGESPLNTDWENASELAKRDIERLEEFWSNKRLGSKSFHDCCTFFCESLTGKSFKGFELHGPEKSFLREKLIASSTFLKPIDKQPKKFLSGVDIDLPAIADAVDEGTKDIINAAGFVNDLISPFRQMYKKIADRKESELKRHQFDVAEVKTAHRELQKRADIFFELAAVLEVTKPWVGELISNRGRPNENLIQHLKDRAQEVVIGRGKNPPHLIDPEKRKPGKELSDELDVVDSSFRLRNAGTILRDVFGTVNAT